MKRFLLPNPARLASVAGYQTSMREVIGLDMTTLPNSEARISDEGILQFRCPPENKIWRDIFWGNNRGPKSRHCKPIKPRFTVGETVYMGEPYQILRIWYGKQMVEGVYLNDDPTQVDDPFNSNGYAILLSDKEWGGLLRRKGGLSKNPARNMYQSLARHFFVITAVSVEEEGGVWYFRYEFKIVKGK